MNPKILLAALLWTIKHRETLTVDTLNALVVLNTTLERLVDPEEKEQVLVDLFLTFSIDGCQSRLESHIIPYEPSAAMIPNSQINHQNPINQNPISNGFQNYLNALENTINDRRLPRELENLIVGIINCRNINSNVDLALLVAKLQETLPRHLSTFSLRHAVEERLESQVLDLL